MEERITRRENQFVGRLTNGWGKFVEGLVEPSIPKLFGELGIVISSLFPPLILEVR